MDLNIKYSIEGYSNFDFKNEYSKVEDAIDNLWSDEMKNPWVKRPMQINEDQIEEIMMTAIAAQDTCGLFVVIGESREILGAKAVWRAIGKKLGTAPEMLFLDESLSSVEIREALEKMRHYEINGCVISREGRRKEILATYSIFKEYMHNRYSSELASKRIMIITSEEDSPLAIMGKNDGSGIFDFLSEDEEYYGIFSYISLLIMAIAGVEIKRFVAGAEVMATNSIWDIDGGNLALLLANIKEELSLINFRDKNYDDLTRWIGLILSKNSSNKIFLNLENTVDDRNIVYNNLSCIGLVINISAQNLEENISLKDEVLDLFEIDNINQLKKSLLEKETNESEVNQVDIYIENSDAFQLGQMMYYFMMIGGILARL